MIQVKSFYAHNDLRNFSYLVFDDQSANAWVIDPWDAAPFALYIKKQGLSLKGILNTHSHFDHIRGNQELSRIFQAPVLQLRSAEKIQLDDEHVLESLDTPGHTLDHQVFIWKQHHQERALFSGDTLFNAGVGNCRNGGNVDLLYETTMKLLQTLAPDTLLYPGHDYRLRNLEFAQQVEPGNQVVREMLSSLKPQLTPELPALTLGEEASINPFLRLSSPELLEQFGQQTNQSGDDTAQAKEIFTQLRSLRDRW
jgi:hydroxyacylglutathione hydrolase